MPAKPWELPNGPVNCRRKGVAADISNKFPTHRKNALVGQERPENANFRYFTLHVWKKAPTLSFGVESFFLSKYILLPGVILLG